MAQSKVKIELNYAGVGQILKSAEMQAFLQSCASRIAGDGSTEVYVAGTRAVAEARGTNTNNSMLKRMK